MSETKRSSTYLQNEKEVEKKAKMAEKEEKKGSKVDILDEDSILH